MFQTFFVYIRQNHKINTNHYIPRNDYMNKIVYNILYITLS